MIEFFRRIFRPYAELKRVIVNLKSGTAFRAVVYSHKGPWMVLHQVEILKDKTSPTKPAVVDGEVLVGVYDIDFVQVIN
jgi:hypothetical protein